MSKALDLIRSYGHFPTQLELIAKSAQERLKSDWVARIAEFGTVRGIPGHKLPPVALPTRPSSVITRMRPLAETRPGTPDASKAGKAWPEQAPVGLGWRSY